MAAKEGRPIRFDPEDLADCATYKIDINEVCREALKNKIKSIKKVTEKMDHEEFEYEGVVYSLSVDLRKEDASFDHEFGTKKQHVYEVTDFKAWMTVDEKQKEVTNKKLIGELFDEYIESRAADSNYIVKHESHLDVIYNVKTENYHTAINKSCLFYFKYLKSINFKKEGK